MQRGLVGSEMCIRDSNIAMQSNYLKLAASLRKFYIQKEIHNNSSRCISSAKLFDIQQRFGASSQIAISKDMNSHSIHCRTVKILADPYFSSRMTSRCPTTSENGRRSFDDQFFHSWSGSNNFLKMLRWRFQKKKKKKKKKKSTLR
eukprot:TRINITY_DN30087_c0_g1_i1.p3 TRINITY_DN30087_c0_g1~~TRINITY_DN30087_c0_g1_i1.p3  ORF type:complete len:146 (+),score=22.83 TRINITY_DN30087_c0_g1_i1:114-551(+)